MSYQISDCRDLGTQQLTAAMNAAFSDYVVPLSMSEQGFADFQRQRGFSAAHSFVAMHAGEIAAFWLSGVPRSAYGDRAYTLSVGTHPRHRRKGLSRSLLDAVLEAQRKASSAGLQLEVVSTNTRAVKAYEKFGFSCRRKLRVCKVKTERLTATAQSGLTFEPVKIEDLPGESEFFDTSPTPQNSRVAMTGLSEKMHVIGARLGENLIGWGAIFEDGAVAQIAVHRNHRGAGVGQGLLTLLGHAVEADQLTFVNVDESASGLNAFLDHAGAEEVLLQLEMHLTL